MRGLNPKRLSVAKNRLRKRALRFPEKLSRARKGKAPAGKDLSVFGLRLGKASGSALYLHGKIFEHSHGIGRTDRRCKDKERQYRCNLSLH